MPNLLSPSYDVLSSTDTNGADLAVAGAELSVTALRFNGPSELDVQGNLSFSDFSGLTLGVGGSNYVALTSSGVSLTGLSVTLPGPTSFTEAGLTFTATDLQVTYAASNNEFELSGSATLAAADNTIDLTLGSPSAPGLVIQNGSLESLDATVTGSFAYSDLTITAQDLTINADAGSNLTVTGTATVDVDVAGNTETFGLTLGSTESGVTPPGLVIDSSTGDLVSFDATINSGLVIGGLTITSNGLLIDYDSTNNEFSVSGAASFTLDGSTVSISLARLRQTPRVGLLLKTANSSILDATLSSTASISVAGATVTLGGLTIDYNSANGDSLAISGSASIMVAGSTFDITLGNSTTSGLVIADGAVQSLYASVTSDLTVGGLTIDVNA